MAAWVALIWPLPALSAADADGWLLNQRTTVIDGVAGELRVTNTHGNIIVRVWSEARVEVTESIQRHPDDPWRWRLATSETEGGLRIAAVGSGQIESAPAAWRKRRVDLSLFVPDACRLVVESRHGDITVKKAEAPVQATSVSGDVTLITSGSVAAASDHGAVVVHFQRTTWNGELVLETLTGPIDVTLPPDASLSAALSTSGRLTSDYSMDVAWAPDTLRKVATITIGEPAGRSLRLTTQRGDLALRRSDSLLLEHRLN
jgi:hypothetical protein